MMSNTDNQPTANNKEPSALSVNSSWGALFPGQGSQHVGMGKFLYDEFTQARHRFEEASDILKQSMIRLLFEGPESDLTLTANAQPALLLCSQVLFEVLTEITGFQPQIALGHSVGEYAALTNAQSISFSDAIMAVRQRGTWMQEAVPVGVGGMCAVMGLDDEQVQKLCRWAVETSGHHPLEPANFNAPGQIVISGSLKAIEYLKAQMSAGAAPADIPKARLIPLAVSAPFHSSAMKPAEEKMQELLNSIHFSDSKWGIIQNVTAKESYKASELRKNLTEQISRPVRWTHSMLRARELGVHKFIEFGSGRVLAGLAKKIDTSAFTVINIQNLDDLKNFEKTFHST